MSEWLPIDVDNPPAAHVVAIAKDDCSSAILSKFDGDPMFYHAEDGFPMEPQDLVENYSMWCAAPDGFRPAFMEVTSDDWL